MARRRDVHDVHFVQCRLLGHAWDEVVSDLVRHGRRTLPGQRMSFRCVRCGTVRDEVWSRDGDLVSRRYIYAEDYQFAKGDRVYAPVFRQVYLIEKGKAGAPVLAWNIRTPIKKEG